MCTDSTNSYTPSQADVLVFKALTSAPEATASPHVARWYKHIQSYAAEHSDLPGSSTAGEAFIGGSAPAPADAADDDEIDLFGSDEEEDADAERIKAERVAEYAAKKANKPKTIAKVRICCSDCRSQLIFSIILVRRDS